MRMSAFACALTLAAASPALAAPPDPQARFTYADLDLGSPAGQDELARRVDEAAADYCRRHAAIVTPHARRAEPRYCPTSIRVQLMWAMPRDLRQAYERGRARRISHRG